MSVPEGWLTRAGELDSRGSKKAIDHFGQLGVCVCLVCMCIECVMCVYLITHGPTDVFACACGVCMCMCACT